MTEPTPPYRVNLPAFEGPLDLLLYLIKRNEVDIWDIPISSITEEYLKHIELMKELNLDVAGEFLLVAAMLTAIKSRLLLRQDDDEDADPLDDPRRPLVERLLEYQQYKEAAEALARRPLLNRDVFRRGYPALNLDEDLPPPLPDVSLFDLLEALQGVLDSAKARGKTHLVQAERFSVVERIHWLHDRMRIERRLRFHQLFEPMEKRMDIVLTFLALLEMLKANILRIEPLFAGDVDDAFPGRPTPAARPVDAASRARTAEDESSGIEIKGETRREHPSCVSGDGGRAEEGGEMEPPTGHRETGKRRRRRRPEDPEDIVVVPKPVDWLLIISDEENDVDWSDID